MLWRYYLLCQSQVYMNYMSSHHGDNTATVEMNPSSGRVSRRSGSLKHNSMGAQELEGTDRRLSDDIYSLHSWSENLSTSSSSESVTHHHVANSNHGSSSFHGRQKRDIRSKTKAAIGMVLHVGQSQKKKASPSPSKQTVTVSTVSSKELEPAAVSSSNSMSNTGYYHRYNQAAFITEPYTNSASMFGHLDAVDGHNSQHDKLGFVETHETKHTNSNRNLDKTSHLTAAHKENLDASKHYTRLYPDLEALQDLDLKGSASPVLPSTSSAATKVNSGFKLFHPGNQRPLLDFQTLPNRHSKKLQNHTDDSEQLNKTLSLPAAGHVSHSHPSANIKQFETHVIQDMSYHNGALPERLHKSQPSIASASLLKRQPKSSNDLESLKLSFEHRLEAENMKTKMKSVWNNLRYGWTFKSKPNFKFDSPLYILGKCYFRKKDDQSSRTEDQFLMDFVSRIWLTYRSNFYPIPGTKLSTDCGWGCMLRTGQMLIAQCLVTHFLGRDWRLYDKQTETDSTFYRAIIRWFSDPIDTPSDKTPFCLHHLANFGRAHNKDPGEWYGPSSVAYIFRDAFAKARLTVPVLSQLCVYVAQDCTVYIDDVIKMCTEKHHSESVSSSSECETEAASSSPGNAKWQRSVIILIPIRLGGELMNEIYIPCVQQLLSQENCMGIIGGKPKHSLYFIGWQDDKLIYLDPHLCREAVDTSISDFRIETYHCMTPRRLTINKMDPSCTVGFYIKDEKDFKIFLQQVKQYVSPPDEKGAYPLFIFADGHMNESAVRQSHPTVDKRTFSYDSEEFVML